MSQINIMIKRSEQKFSESVIPREYVGKHGRMARMFAKSRAMKALQNASKPNYSRPENAVRHTTLDFERAKRTAKIDITHHVNLRQGNRPITVRAKEKIRRGVRELIRLSQLFNGFSLRQTDPRPLGHEIKAVIQNGIKPYTSLEFFSRNTFSQVGLVPF